MPTPIDTDMSYLQLDSPVRAPVPNPAASSTPTAPTQECDCPFPWWLLILGAAVGGVGGYAAGRRSARSKASSLAP
ncbi:MAG: hypothetical protein AB7S26_29050 [Sandaracinaceae bacterium]